MEAKPVTPDESNTIRNHIKTILSNARKHTMNTINETHLDHTITLNKYMMFEIKGPVLNGEHAASFSSAKEKIEEAIKQHNAQKRTMNRLALPVLTDTGMPTVFRGFHARTGDVLLGAKEYSKYGHLFPDVPWLKEKLVKRGELRKAVEAIDNEVKVYALRLSHDRYLNYDDSIAKAEKEIAEKTSQAQMVPTRLTVVEKEPKPAA